MPVNNNTQNLLRLRPTLFQPSIVRGLVEETNGVAQFQKETAEFSVGQPVNDSGSFRYDPDGIGLKSTQQLNIDWSRFANHCFFNSAEVKVNTAFDKIIDRFPFDGTEKETTLFFDGLTGYEKYVYDLFPKNKGYLWFSGSTYVTVKDVAGASYPEISRIKDGGSVLNPKNGPLTTELWLWLPPVSNSQQTVFEKIGEPSTGVYHGFYLGVLSTGSVSTAKLQFGLQSGSTGMTADFTVPKGAFNHIAVEWDRTPGVSNVSVYVNQQFVTKSLGVEIGTLNFDSASFFIGSGSGIPAVFVPQTTLSGAVDELRVWHSLRTVPQLKQYATKPVFSENDLKLYFKFNEPSGSMTPLVLDSSGKGIHGNLSAYAVANKIRNVATASVAGISPMINEPLSASPILFPDHPGVGALSVELLKSASTYDNINPNLITKLVPSHLLLEGQQLLGYGTETGYINTISTGSIPSTYGRGQAQPILLLLYTWATFFDELKLFTDQFSNLFTVSYDNIETVPDQFLQQLAQRHGITLPPLFVGASIAQYVNGENLDSVESTNDYSLRYIQNQIWRRILLNLRDIQTSKGTIHSIKAFIRTLGIEPDNNFRMREYGGPTRKSLLNAREKKSEIAAALSFTSGGLIRSGFLSGSRTEKGLPQVLGSYVVGADGRVAGTTNKNDGLFTTSSWSIEGMFRMPTLAAQAPQSLVRLQTTGSAGEGVLYNLVAVNSNTLTLYGRPNTGSAVAPFHTISLTGPNLYNGDQWHICFGVDSTDTATPSSSYFLRAARQQFGDIVEDYTTSSFFNNNSGGFSSNLLTNISTAYNASGAFLAIGSQSLTSMPYLLNDATITAVPYSTTTNFKGVVSQLRFWSKALALDESREHVRNFKSIGTTTPSIENVFENYETGSFAKLRADFSMDQPVVSASVGGQIILTDFTQHLLHASGVNFPASTKVVLPERFFYSYLSPKFDEAVTTNKVRVRSFQNIQDVYNNEFQYAEQAPLYEIRKSEEAVDSNKFSIDFSIVDALNEDIVAIFATFDELENAIGNPNLTFAQEYPQLSVLRDLYFNRLTDKVNLKGFFEFFKWFDTNIGSFISQLVPRKTAYLGTNFIIESHMLERPKYDYKFDDVYLTDGVRDNQRGSILTSFLTADIRRY